MPSAFRQLVGPAQGTDQAGGPLPPARECARRPLSRPTSRREKQFTTPNPNELWGIYKSLHLSTSSCIFPFALDTTPTRTLAHRCAGRQVRLPRCEEAGLYERFEPSPVTHPLDFAFPHPCKASCARRTSPVTRSAYQASGGRGPAAETITGARMSNEQQEVRNLSYSQGIGSSSLAGLTVGELLDRTTARYPSAPP